MAIAAALGIGVVALVVGALISDRLGLFDERIPATERFALGLGVGLLAIAAVYAVAISRGSSSLTPVAVFGVAAVAAARGRPLIRRQPVPPVKLIVASAAVVVGAALLMAVTLAPSPRDGVQPVEFMDEAYYALLSVDLNATGREWIYAPSGFHDLPALPEQTWYHWGEAWLGAAALNIPSVTPLHARHLVVLPLILLAAAALAGSVTRRLPGLGGRQGFLLGAVGMLLLAPVPLVFENHFDWWATAFLFTVTQYGLVIVPLLILLLVTFVRRPTGSWPNALFIGVLTASVVSLHIAITPFAGLATAVAIILVAFSSRPTVSHALQSRSFVLTAVIAVVAAFSTLVWGFATGHGIGAVGRSEGIEPFAEVWRRSVVLTTIGGLALLVAPLGAWVLRSQGRAWWAWAIASGVAVAVAAVLWGATFDTFNTFHVFFGTLGLILVPIALAGIGFLLVWARSMQRPTIALLISAVLVIQIGIGGATAVYRLWQFGPRRNPPIDVDVLASISALPTEAKLAYVCKPLEEFAFWDPMMVSITAHTGRTVVPLCFMADTQRKLLGGSPDETLESPFFRYAPQRTLYPDPTSSPTQADIEQFLRDHRIDYIYTDQAHPEMLMDEAEAIFSSGDVAIYQVPWSDRDVSE